jgi:hypothetical protein
LIISISIKRIYEEFFNIHSISVGDFFVDNQKNIQYHQSSQIWMLDEHGCVFYRAGITKETPRGEKWSRAHDRHNDNDTEFLATSLSVSNLAKLVFCVSAKDGCVYFCESENEIGWKKMSIEFQPEKIDIENSCDPPARNNSSQRLNSTGNAEDSKQIDKEQIYVDENLDIYENERNSIQFNEYLSGSTNFDSRFLKTRQKSDLHISLKKNTVETIVSELRLDRADSFIERIRKANEIRNSSSKLILLHSQSVLSDHGKSMD